MHHYRFHIGDYAAHTRHLTPIEDLAYRRAIDLYYLHERPLNGRSPEIARSLGLVGHEDAVDAVLREFFVLEEGRGHVHKRIEDDLAEYRRKSELSAKAGQASGKARRRTGVQRTLAKPRTDVQPTTNQEPVPTNQGTPPSEEKRAARCVSVERPQDVSPETWGEFLAFRRKKQAPVTELVMSATARKAADAGLSMEEALVEWISNGTTGFFPKSPGSRGAPANAMRERFKHLEPGQPNPWGDGPTVRDL